MIESELLTVAQVAAILGVSVYSVRNYVKKGLLCPIVLGPRTIRYEKKEVYRLLRSQKVCC